MDLPDSVKTIGESAFQYCHALRNVVIPEGVSTIEAYAFYSCGNLAAVVLPKSVVSVADSAFSGCSKLADVFYGGSEEERGNIAISSSNSYLTNATWHYGVAAENVAIISVETKDGGVITAPMMAAKGETVTVTVASILPGYRFDGIKVNGVEQSELSFTVSAGGSVTVTPVFTKVVDATVGGVCGENAYWALVDTDADGTAEKLVIYGTGTMADYGDESGGYYSRPWSNYTSQITSAEVTDGITYVGRHAFRGISGLKSAKLGDAVTTVGSYAFYDCKALEDIDFGDTVEAIGNYAFAYCEKLETVDLGDSIVTIGNYAFRQCYALTKIEFGNMLTTVGDYAFYECKKLETIDLGNALTAIGTGAFSACSALTFIEIPTGVSEIKTSTFNGCVKLSYMVLPESVVSVGESAFANCSALSHVFYEGDEADRAAMTVSPYSNTYFTGAKWHYGAAAEDVAFITVMEGEGGTVTAPSMAAKGETVTVTITSAAIGYEITGFIVNGETVVGNTFTVPCSGAVSVTPIFTKKYDAEIGGLCGESVNWVLLDADNDGTAEKLVLFGAGAMQNYSSASDVPWHTYRSQITAVEMTEGITAIGNYAFRDCVGVTEIEIPESVTAIEKYAFYNCDGLTEIVIPEGVSEIGANAFESCSALERVDLPDSLTYMGSYAFSGCSKLKEIVIPAGVTQISSDLFYSCPALERVTLHDGITSIGGWAFASCSKLTALDLPDQLTEIGNYAFYYCTKLAALEIPDTVTSIGYSAFRNCSALMAVEIPAGVTAIASETFENCSALTTVVLPKSIASVGQNAFKGCSKLADVYYAGSEEDRALITVDATDDGNSYLENAAWHYNVTAEDIASITVEANEFGTFAVIGVAPKGTSVTAVVTSVVPGYELVGLEVNGTRVEGLTFTVPSGGEVTVKGVFAKVTDAETGGLCGDNAYWALVDADADGTAEKLLLYGTGAMTSWSGYSYVPWYNYRGQITSAEVADGITAIGNCAFYYCSALENLVLAKSVAAVNNNAFYSCSKLAHVFYSGSEEDRAAMSIGETNNSKFTNATWHYGVVAADIAGIAVEENAYASATVPAIAAKGESVTVVLNSVAPGYRFDAIEVNGETVEGLTFTVPSGGEITVKLMVTKVIDAAAGGLCGDNAYWALTDTDADGTGDKLVFFGEGAMKNWTSGGNTPWTSYRSGITSVEVMNGITTVGDYAFSGCSALTEVRFAESVAAIGKAAFYNCSALKGIEIPAGVSEIAANTFYYCSKLEAIVLPESVVSVGSSAFYNCSKLAHVFYGGSESDKAGISVSSTSNSKFTSAAWYYETTSADVVKVTLNAGEHGSVSGSSIACKGQSYKVSVTPNRGYAFDYLLVNGEKVADTTCVMPDANEVTVSVVYKRLSTTTKCVTLTDGYKFTLTQFDEETSHVYIAFYNADGRMVKIFSVDVPLDKDVSYVVKKADLAGTGCVVGRVFYTDSNGRPLDARVGYKISDN